MEQKDVVIIGGGPAGLAAAVELHKQGIRNMIILEREAMLGGILRQCIHDGFGLGRFGESLSGPEYAQAFIDEVNKREIPYETSATVLSLTEDRVVTASTSILEKTNEAGIPVYGSEIEQVKLGCVASAGIEYVALGRQTGMMAAKILKGEAKASDMPYETISEFEIYVNPDAMAALKLSADVENAIDVTAE